MNVQDTDLPPITIPSSLSNQKDVYLEMKNEKEKTETYSKVFSDSLKIHFHFLYSFLPGNCLNTPFFTITQRLSSKILSRNVSLIHELI